MYAPIVTGIFGKTLHMIDKKMLQLPSIGGVILFSHNLESKLQTQMLIESIQNIRIKYNLPKLLILIDHEGGVVQRLRGPDFSRLPSAAFIGKTYDQNKQDGLDLIKSCAHITANELLDMGINVCLSPVLDLLKPNTKEEHTRFYSDKARVISTLTAEYIGILLEYGILPVAKHFPGIGKSKTNTHYSVAISDSTLNALLEDDLYPYIYLQKKNLLPAIMTAHRVYPEVDIKPVCTSKKWVDEILRQQLQYDGMVFTDCVQMGGASLMGGTLSSKIYDSLKAGCDFVLSSQTPFGSYKELYNTLSSTKMENLLTDRSFRQQQINHALEPFQPQVKSLHLECEFYLNSKKILNQHFNEKVTIENKSKKIPVLYQFKASLIKNQRLKKYIKANRLLQRINLYHFRLRMMVYKIKQQFIK